MSVTSQPGSHGLAAELTPVLSERFALRGRHAVVCGVFAVFFLYLSYIPLFHSDLWGHVNYGRWILEHRQLPAEDPFFPLAEGVRVIDTAWLAQVIFAQADAWGGAHALSMAFALVVFVEYLVYARVFYLQSGRVGLMLLGVVLLLALGWTRHAIIRPEIFGGLCFAVLLWLLVRCEPWRSRCAVFSAGSAPSGGHLPWLVWLGMPTLFALWANLHGSFAVGLVVLACHALGRGLETLWRTKSPLAVLADRGFRNWVFLTELCLAATLLNPYGFELLVETATFGKNPNLRDVLEWYPLKLIDFEGWQFGASVLLLILLLRHSRQRVHPTEAFLLLFLVLGMAATVRLIGWYAPAFVFAMLPHGADLWSRYWPDRGNAVSAPARPLTAQHFKWSLIAALLVWCAFALSPLSQPLLGGKQRSAAQLYSKGTPLAVTEFLREHPPKQMLFGPQWWGDWLVWDGPPDMRVFMTTHLHLAPKTVWRDYMRVARAESGWEAILDRYQVGMVVVDKELQTGLTRAVRRSGNWRVAYEDGKALVVERKPAPNG